MFFFFLWMVTPSFAQVHSGDTGWWDDSTCASGENDGPGEYLGGESCGAPIMVGYCTYHFGGACPDLDSFRDELREPYGYGYTGPCSPTDPVAFSANFSFNEGGTTYYFDPLGAMVGAEAWSGLGYGCCEGHEVYYWTFGVTGPCTPWDPRKMKFDDEPEDSTGCGGGCAVVGVLGLTGALRRRRR